VHNMNRNYTRQYYETKILFSTTDKNTWDKATMKNISKGGMYFESHLYLNRGDTIAIEFADKTANNQFLHPKQNICSKVIWCHSINKEAKTLYGIGILFNKR